MKPSLLYFTFESSNLPYEMNHKKYVACNQNKHDSDD